MYSITLKSILNDVQPIKGFVYESVSYSTAVVGTIEVVVVPQTGFPTSVQWLWSSRSHL